MAIFMDEWMMISGAADGNAASLDANLGKRHGNGKRDLAAQWAGGLGG
jgi:hypothetical protein